ncbi:nucleoprotein TPR-like isoform X1 [Cynoglossus semilaevis]|uniref:Translocated promoter region, nuclear basket protein n=1 Tax=Cynoglossus semilaevis TaxID=244447 RepID=A0A3P8WLG3_CYNSE|nr:nucleoprotein TPR-like isoform X1 [Cynoglossus semilaevis]
MAAVLLQALERTEVNKLPKGVQNKLEKFVTELQNANEALRTHHERYKADSEQQYFDMEKRLVESQERTLSTTKDLQTIKEENKKLNDELNTVKGIEGETFQEKTQQQQTKTKFEIETEKNELARLLEKRTREVENLTENVKRLNEKLTETNKVKMELQLKLDDIQSSETSVQHREKRIEQEKELLEKKIEWLTAELKTKSDEVLNISKDKGKETLELQGNLKNSEEQMITLKNRLESLTETCESQTKRAEDLNNKLKQAKDERLAMEEKYRNELNAHVKLSSLYKGAATDMEKKNQELSRAVEGLSKVVKEAGEATKSLEKKVLEGEEVKRQLEAELGEKLKKMEKELENATMKAAGKHCCGPAVTEEQLNVMCPSAAAIAAIVKPGMKFFDLYNAYADCQTQLQLEKQESRRVNKVLDEIVQEVESKAPVLKRQREEYEGIQRSMASICNKLEQARAEIHNLQKEKEELKQLYENLEKEKLKTERQLDDTSSQVCALLVELEETRGNPVNRSESSSADISSTTEVVGSNQFTFRSVEELQRQNQNLLGRLRDLEQEKEGLQERATSERVSELEASVDKFQKEVEQLREQKNQQKQLADSSARQRDMYKALLTQSTGFSLPLQGLESTTPQPASARGSVPVTRSTPQRAAAAESGQSAQTKAALKQLNDAFTVYKKEKAENDRMLNETNDRLQKQIHEFQSSQAKMTAQLEFSNKRYEILQETVSAYRRENAALQDRNQKMSALIQRHEHAIHTMTQDLQQATAKLALEEARVQNVTKEKDIIRESESRLTREKEAILAEQRNQNLLLINLKTIQLTMERTETETRQLLNNKIDHLEAELATLKKKLDQEVAQRHALGRTMDAQLLEAKKQLATQNVLHQKTRDLLRSSEQQVAALKAQLASTSTSDAANNTSTPVATRAAALRAPLRGRPQAPPASSQQSTQDSSQSELELAEVKGLLHTAEEQNSELKEQLKIANTSVEQYRALVLALEDTVKEEKEIHASMEIQLKESKEVQNQLEKRIIEVEKKGQQEQEEKRKARESLEKQVADLQRRLKESQTEQQEAVEKAAAALTQEQKATQESLLQTKLAGEAHSKYERELMLHAADVEALQELKKRIQQDLEKKTELEEQLNNTNTVLQEKTAAWNALEKELKEEQSTQSHRCEELEKQNTLLHQQMDEIASRSRQQQQQQQPDVSFSEEGKSTEQILEILRFVRQEEQIALARCEVSEGKAVRYKQQVEHQGRELKELQEALNAERKKMQITAKTLSQQEEQLKKMSSINALQETNRILKTDREKLQQELLQAQAKVTKLQSDINPLHHSLSMLLEKNGSLQADKRLLEEDVKHWKVKAQQLMSQQKDGNVEERQKLTAEKEAQQRRITQLIEEIAKLKAELARSNASTNSAQSQLQSLKDSVANLTSEKESLKKDVETKNTEMLEKNKTITQVKKIGRRYKTQYEELKSQHDKLVAETATKAGSEAAPNQDLTQQLSKAQEELVKSKEEVKALKEEMQKKQQETQKAQHDFEEAQKETQKSKELHQNVQNQLTQNQSHLTQIQTQLSQTQAQLQQNQNQLTQCQKDLQQTKTQAQQAQNQMKSAQSQAQARQNHIQQLQRELQQTKETLQQNLTSQKELQQTHQNNQNSHNQEVGNLKTTLSQAEAKVTELQGQLDSLQKTVGEREADVQRLQKQLTEASQAPQTKSSQSADANAAGDTNQAVQEEVAKLQKELNESKNREEQLKQQMAEKEEKTLKVIMRAKTKINQLITAKEQLAKEIEELKQNKEELEVRMNALKSQYEGRLLRLDRELREAQAHSDTKDEPLDQSGAKAADSSRSAEQRQVSLKSPAQDRGGSSLSEPPTANIRPTPSTPSPNNKPSPSPGNKSTPRASIRPMVTPASVPTPTPTATVMPTTQTDSQEVLISAGTAVHSTSSGLVMASTSMTQPTSTQATAFVQPTQQQTTSQEAASSMEVERPSTSSSLIGAGSKRVREDEDEDDEEESRPESSHTTPTTKKLRLKAMMALQVEFRDEVEEQDSQDGTQELPEESFPVLAEEDEDMGEEGVSQSVPSFQMSDAPSLTRDVIVLDTDSESRESKEGEEIMKQDNEGEDQEEEEEEAEEEEEEDDEDEDDAGDGGLMGGDESNDKSGDAEEHGVEAPSESTTTEEDVGRVSSDSHHVSEPPQSSESSSSIILESDTTRETVHLPPASSSSSVPSPSSSLTPHLPQPRRPLQSLPPRLYIQPPAPELGPPHTQRQSSQLRRPSVGRGLQLTPGIANMQHFFDDDDRMVPSTPTLVVPHRTDGFAEAIHSPQVAGLSTRFRFGPPEDLLSQTSGSHSDLGQLASQGGLGMYESPLFLAAHDEDGGGRSVPTTPLQVAAPVTVFTESLPSDTGDNMASQSVPMVTASTSMSAAVDDGDEVFVEQEAEGSGIESSLESQTEAELTGQQSDDASLPSTSTDPDTSSVMLRRTVNTQPQISRGARGGRDIRITTSRRGPFSRGGRGGAMGRGGMS